MNTQHNVPFKKRNLTHLALSALCAAGCFVALSCALPSTSFADLYTYKKPDGTLLVTTSPRKGKGFKLIEHIKGGGGESTSSRGSRRVSDKHRKSYDLAMSRKARTRTVVPPSNGREHAYDDIIREASKAYQIPVAFIKGVIKVESNFHPTVVSHTGAMGLMQLMPSTASYLGVEDAFDPRQNIFGGTKLLRILTNRYNGDINLLLSAYNAGEGAVDRYDGIPYDQTREYVRKVYGNYKRFQEEENQQKRQPATASTAPQ